MLVTVIFCLKKYIVLFLSFKRIDFFKHFLIVFYILQVDYIAFLTVIKMIC